MAKIQTGPQVSRNQKSKCLYKHIYQCTTTKKDLLQLGFWQQCRKRGQLSEIIIQWMYNLQLYHQLLFILELLAKFSPFAAVFVYNTENLFYDSLTVQMIFMF